MSSQPSLPLPEPSGPRLHDADAALDPSPAVAQAAPASTRDFEPLLGVVRAEVYAYLEGKASRSLVKRVVRAHVARKTPRFVCEDIESDAVTRMLEAKQPPTRPEAMDAWACVVTARAVVDYFRRGASDMRWLRRDVEAADQPAEPPEALDGDDKWLLSTWLAEQVKDDAADKVTFDLILEKGRTGRSYEQIAAERGMTPAALSNRIYRMKLKYLPRRLRHEEQRNRMILMWLLAGAAAVVVVIAYLLLGTAAPEIEPRVRGNAPHPVRGYDGTFNQAAPTEPIAPLKPGVK